MIDSNALSVLAIQRRIFYNSSAADLSAHAQEKEEGKKIPPIGRLSENARIKLKVKRTKHDRLSIAL